MGERLREGADHLLGSPREPWPAHLSQPLDRPWIGDKKEILEDQQRVNFMFETRGKSWLAAVAAMGLAAGGAGCGSETNAVEAPECLGKGDLSSAEWVPC